MMLGQIDKVVLSKCLSLESFGRYALISSLASVISLSAGSVANGIFPRLTQLYAVDASRDRIQLAGAYHKACQVMSILVISPGLVFSFVSVELLRLWTGSPVVTPEMALSLAMLSIGNALNSIMVMPLMLQMAAGWTRLAVCTNAIGIVLVVPAVILLATRYGAAGAASVWLSLNLAYVLLMVPIMHSRLLVGELRHWYTADVGKPLLGAFIVCILSRACMPQAASIPVIIVWIAVTGVCAMTASLLSAPTGFGLIRTLVAHVLSPRSTSLEVPG